MSKQHIFLMVNGLERELLVEPNQTLTQVLRDQLRLTGTKHGCGIGDCGSCTVLMDGQAINSCLLLALEAVGHEITTIEGLAEGNKLHPLQDSFIELGAIQCGFCSPGMLLSSKALLSANPLPTEEEIRWGLSGNLCRCTGYQKIVEAVEDAAQKMKGVSS